ncbi:MAG: ATP-binding protein [Rhizobiaceae bacterium]|nr:ATP-binding protein [Rhizobiaceae bacterium]
MADNFGETRLLDFKREWPAWSTLAKHILGIANTGTGCLVIGVEENGDGSANPIGLNALRDKIDITKGVKGYIPSPLADRISVYDFSYNSSEYEKLQGKIFQVMFIEHSSEHTPFVAVKSGEGIREGAVYIRQDAGTTEASYDKVQELINDRIDGNHSTTDETDLKKHIEHLRILYTEIPVHQSLAMQMAAGLMGQMYGRARKPEESFDDFLLKMIEMKKSVIAQHLGVAKAYAGGVNLNKMMALITRK